METTFLQLPSPIPSAVSELTRLGIGIGIFYFSDRKHTNRVNMIFDKIIRCLDQWMTV